LYDKDNVVDCIVLLTIYMLIIRREVSVFVRLWNIHLIRKQRNRLNVVVEKSFKNYFWLDDEMQNFQMISFSNLLAIMKVNVTNWDKDMKLFIVVRSVLMQHKYWRVSFLFNKRMMWCQTSRIELQCEYDYCRHDIF
jgi:hypothetical protein